MPFFISVEVGCLPNLIQTHSISFNNSSSFNRWLDTRLNGFNPASHNALFQVPNRLKYVAAEYFPFFPYSLLLKLSLFK